MTRFTQKRLAIGAAVTIALLFLAANAHLLTVAMQSQPECLEAAGATPAKKAC